MRDSILTAARLNPRFDAGELACAAAGLHAVVDRLQSATGGNPVLDALIEDALMTLSCPAGPLATARVRSRLGARWSEDLSASIGLLSVDYNFSLGQRDGICWAWIQPNDNWVPEETESRHDHPEGSGLIVAYTTALAMTTATIVLCTRQLWAARGTLG